MSHGLNLVVEGDDPGMEAFLEEEEKKKEEEEEEGNLGDEQASLFIMAFSSNPINKT